MDSEGQYLIVMERSQTGFSVYSPDVPGCVATGETLDEAVAEMHAALTLHLRAIIEEGEPLPLPQGAQAYLLAASDSVGEEYYLTHIAVGRVTPALALP